MVLKAGNVILYLLRIEQGAYFMKTEKGFRVNISKLFEMEI